MASYKDDLHVYDQHISIKGGLAMSKSNLLELEDHVVSCY